MQTPEKAQCLTRYSNLQWYLANANNTVHLIAASPHQISEREFREIVDEVVANAPQLHRRQDNSRGGFVGTSIRLKEVISEQSCVVTPELNEVMARAGKPFDDQNGALRARLFNGRKPNSEGMRSILFFESSHALMEGDDIANLLRGKKADHDSRPIVDHRPSLAARVAIAILAPLAAIAHVLTAKLEKTRRSDFRFAAMDIDRAKVKLAARKFGVSQQTMLFALVLKCVSPKAQDGKSLLLNYTTLPRERTRIADDTFLNVRVQETRLKGHSDFQTFLHHLEENLSGKDGAPLFTMALYNRVIEIHRRLHRLMPSAYKGNFFGFSPSDMLLSMLPPLRADRHFKALKDARIYTHSLTGTTPNCLFVMGEDFLTLNFWGPESILSNTDRIPPLLDHVLDDLRVNEAKSTFEPQAAAAKTL